MPVATIPERLARVSVMQTIAATTPRGTPRAASPAVGDAAAATGAAAGGGAMPRPGSAKRLGIRGPLLAGGGEDGGVAVMPSPLRSRGTRFFEAGGRDRAPTEAAALVAAINSPRRSGSRGVSTDGRSGVAATELPARPTSARSVRSLSRVAWRSMFVAPGATDVSALGIPIGKPAGNGGVAPQNRPRLLLEMPPQPPQDIPPKVLALLQAAQRYQDIQMHPVCVSCCARRSLIQAAANGAVVFCTLTPASNVNLHQGIRGVACKQRRWHHSPCRDSVH